MHENDDIESLVDSDINVRERLEFGKLSDRHKVVQLFFSFGIIALMMSLVGIITQALLKSCYGLSGAEIVSDLDYFLTEFKGKLNCFRAAQMINTTIMFGGAAFIMSYLISGKLFGFFRFDKKANKASLLIIPLMLISIIPIASFIAFNIQQLDFLEKQLAAEAKTLALQKALIGEPSIITFAINFLMIAILPAVFEELFFRGILQKLFIQLIENRNPGHASINVGEPRKNLHHVGIIITGIIFGAIHMQVSNFIPITILGILLGYIYWWTKNLWYPIIAHLIFNGFQATSFYVLSNQPNFEEMQEVDVLPYAQTILSLIVFVGCTYLFFQLNKNTANANG